jgi:hypothetical protein
VLILILTKRLVRETLPSSALPQPIELSDATILRSVLHIITICITITIAEHYVSANYKSARGVLWYELRKVRKYEISKYELTKSYVISRRMHPSLTNTRSRDNSRGSTS